MTWIQKNKYPLMVTAFFIVVALLIWVFIRSIEKDHTLDLVKQEIKLKEQAREQIQAEREQKELVVAMYSDSIRKLQSRDINLINQVINLNNQIDNLSKKYHEKATVINTYGSDDLLNYFRSLPKQPDNDY